MAVKLTAILPFLPFLPFLASRSLLPSRLAAPVAAHGSSIPASLSNKGTGKACGVSISVPSGKRMRSTRLGLCLHPPTVVQSWITSV